MKKSIIALSSAIIASSVLAATEADIKYMSEDLENYQVLQSSYLDTTQIELGTLCHEGYKYLVTMQSFRPMHSVHQILDENGHGISCRTEKEKHERSLKSDYITLEDAKAALKSAQSYESRSELKSFKAIEEGFVSSNAQLSATYTQASTMDNDHVELMGPPEKGQLKLFKTTTDH